MPALVLADAALTQALGWDHVVPLLATGLKCADLRKRDDDLRLVCHHALVSSAVEAVRRLCDGLVDLGVVRELTGRDTFWLYGV